MLKAFRCQQFEHTHENKIFDVLYDALATHCAATQQDWVLFGNFYVGGRELDALVVKPNALIIIDFKDYAGRLSISEDGPWLIENTANGQRMEVRGGASVNPLVQLRQNKRALVGFMDKVSQQCTWGHIAAMALFHGAVEFDAQQIPGSCKPWLHITSMGDSIRNLEAIVSREIHILPSDIQYIVNQLGFSPFTPASAVETYSLTGPVGSATNRDKTCTVTQKQALAEFSAWLEKPTGAFRLLGMASTGKRFLFPLFVELIKKSGRSPILLTPSARLNANYFCDDVEPASMYRWLYDQAPSSFAEEKGLKIALHAVREAKIDVRDLPVLVDAHLMSDEEFGLSTRRYGSGHLITDFLSKMGGAPFVVIGDPYQMPRGKRDRAITAFVAPHYLAESQTHLLTEQILAQQDDAVNALQRHLTDCINKGRFSKLPKFDGKRLDIVEKDSDRVWVPDTETLIPQSVFLCATHERAKHVNDAIKKCLFPLKDSAKLAEGERVEFYSYTSILAGPDADNIGDAAPQWISPGSTGIIDEFVGPEEPEPQPLRGRPSPILIRTQEILCRVEGRGQVRIRFLLDFYEATRPKLPVDYQIALQALARSKARPRLEEYRRNRPILDGETSRQIEMEYKKLKDGKTEKSLEDVEVRKRYEELVEARRQYDLFEYNLLQAFSSAARIRPAYAMTVDRAQGLRWPCIWLDVSPRTGDRYANQGYFRLLYTATTSAEDQLVIQNFPQLDSMLEAVVKRHANLRIGPIAIKRGLHYDKARTPTKEEEASVVMPVGFSDLKLIPLTLELMDRLKNSPWRITHWQEHSYQVLMTLSSGESGAAAKVRLYYDGALSVTNVMYLETAPEDCGSVDRVLSKPFAPESQALGEALNDFLDRVAPCDFQLASAKESSYKIALVLSRGEDAVELELNAGKDGMVSSVLLLKATTEDILAEVESILKGRQ